MTRTEALATRDALITELRSLFPETTKSPLDRVSLSQLNTDLDLVPTIKKITQGNARFGYFKEGYFSCLFKECPCSMVFDQLSGAAGLVHFDSKFSTDINGWGLMPQGIYTVIGVDFKETWRLGSKMETFQDKGFFNKLIILTEGTDLEPGYYVYFFPSIEKIYIGNEGKGHVYVLDKFKTPIIEIPGAQYIKDYLWKGIDISNTFTI